MRWNAVQLALLQMRQQAPSEDAEVLIAQSLEQQRCERLRCGHNVDGALAWTLSRPRYPHLSGGRETDETEDAASNGAGADLE